MYERRQNPFTDDFEDLLARVPDALQAAWVRQLRWFYDHFNWEYASSRLRPPVFALGTERGKLGQWDPVHRTITISVCHILENSWETVIETLRHEMAHQFVDEVMQVAHTQPHGDAFAEACRVLRCDPRASAPAGALGAIAGSPAERDRILLRVRELLALAGSPNEHEAASAMRMAHRHLLKYNLSLVEIHGEREYGSRQLGRVAARVQEWEYTLGHILQEHFFVLSLWTFSYGPPADGLGRVLEISGTSANLEVAAHVYEYLTTVVEELWRERRRVPREKRGTKRQYLAGLMRGFLRKLDRQKSELEEERALVWKGDRGLDRYYRYRNPKTSSTTGRGVARGHGYHAGVADGESIRIRRPLEDGTRDRGRALPGG